MAAISLGLPGCAASGAKVLPPSGNSAYGVYPFREVLASAHPPVTLEGEVALLPDTVNISLKDGLCAYHPSSRGNIRTIIYQCGEFQFRFDRRHPLRDNSYQVPTVTWQDRRVCLMSSVDPRTGREVCERYGSERVERRTVITGKITFLAK